MRSAAVIGIVSLFMAVPAIAGSFEDAMLEYERGEYIAAYQLIRPLAEQGDPDAQLMLGFMYDMGHGVPQDFAEMEKWYKRAARQGNTAAQSTVRLMEERSRMEAWYRGDVEPGDAAARPDPLLLEERSGKGTWYRGAGEAGNAAARPDSLLLEERSGKKTWYRGATE